MYYMDKRNNINHPEIFEKIKYTMEVKMVKARKRLFKACSFPNITVKKTDKLLVVYAQKQLVLSRNI